MGLKPRLHLSRVQCTDWAAPNSGRRGSRPSNRTDSDIAARRHLLCHGTPNYESSPAPTAKSEFNGS